MNSVPPFKLAFIGTHGVGKTTLCYGLAARLKARDFSVEVVHEVARRCPLPINEETGLASESWILHTQVAEEVLALARYSIVVCDRSVLDNYVYLLLSAGRQESLDAFVGPWLETYDLLVHVPIVDDPSPDGLRSVDPAFQRSVDDRLLLELERHSLRAMTLDPSRRNRWVDDVFSHLLERLRPAQMDLLDLHAPKTFDKDE